MGLKELRGIQVALEENSILFSIEAKMVSVPLVYSY